MKKELEKKNKLTKKELLFSLAYTGETKFNATKAAEIAGYSAKTNETMRAIGHENLTKPHIQEKIKELTEQRLKDAGYNVDRVTKEIIDVAFADITQFIDKNGKINIDPTTQPTAAIKELEQKILIGNDEEAYTNIKLKLHDKKWPIEMLSKLLQMESGININRQIIEDGVLIIHRNGKDEEPD